MVTLLLKTVADALGGIFKDGIGKYLGPIDQTRKSSYQLFVGIGEISGHIEALRKLLNSDTRLPITRLMASYVCSNIGGALERMSAAVPGMRVQFEIYGDLKILSKLDEWIPHEMGFVAAIKLPETAQELRELQEELSSLSATLNELRFAMKRFIGTNYSIRDRPDGR